MWRLIGSLSTTEESGCQTKPRKTPIKLSRPESKHNKPESRPRKTLIKLSKPESRHKKTRIRPSKPESKQHSSSKPKLNC
jgi:hypothetical protein